MKIVCIGLGSMGAPIAQNLLNAGFDVTVYNRTPEKAAIFSEKGAVIASSPSDAARSCDIVITMLSNDQAVEEVVFGHDGIWNALREGSIHISMSTISVELSRKLEKAHEEKNQYYLSAPVMGRPEMAKNALLRVLMAGNKKAQAIALPVMEVLGQEVFSLGEEAWHGNAVKIGTNFLLSSMIESLSEAQSLVKELGMEPSVLMRVVNAFFQSPIYENYGNIMLKGQFDPPGFRMKLGAKDVGLVQNAASIAGLHLPLGNLLEESFQKGLDAGNGESDWCAVIKNYEKE